MGEALVNGKTSKKFHDWEQVVAGVAACRFADHAPRG
jgi:hypothetical protein